MEMEMEIMLFPLMIWGWEITLLSSSNDFLSPTSQSTLYFNTGVVEDRRDRHTVKSSDVGSLFEAARDDC